MISITSISVCMTASRTQTGVHAPLRAAQKPLPPLALSSAPVGVEGAAGGGAGIGVGIGVWWWDEMNGWEGEDGVNSWDGGGSWEGRGCDWDRTKGLDDDMVGDLSVCLRVASGVKKKIKKNTRTNACLLTHRFQKWYRLGCFVTGCDGDDGDAGGVGVESFAIRSPATRTPKKRRVRMSGRRKPSTSAVGFFFRCFATAAVVRCAADADCERRCVSCV